MGSLGYPVALLAGVAYHNWTQYPAQALECLAAKHIDSDAALRLRLYSNMAIWSICTNIGCGHTILSIGQF